MAEKKVQEVKASLRFLRQGPRKVRLLTDVIRGMEVLRARAELLHIPKRASVSLLKLLDSAVANAKNNFHLKEEGLFVKQIRVDQGPSLKRFTPRAHGRATGILRRSSHVNLVLGVREETPASTAKRGEQSSKLKTQNHNAKQKTDKKDKDNNRPGKDS